MGDTSDICHGNFDACYGMLYDVDFSYFDDIVEQQGKSIIDC
jgi:hypothetical protein